MTYGDANGGLAFLMVFWAVGGLLGLGLYVWYLWALSRLFPYLGLPSGWGWIPVWNQWQLIQRGGLPGWLVLLGLVPGLGIVVAVVSVIAIHRINAEFGKGAGFTVLGFFLPPLWATLLANHIADQGYATGPGGTQRSGAQAVAAPAGQGGNGFAPQQTFPQQPFPQQDQGWQQQQAPVVPGPIPTAPPTPGTQVPGAHAPQHAPGAPAVPAAPADQGGWHAQQSVFGSAPAQPFVPQEASPAQPAPAVQEQYPAVPPPPAQVAPGSQQPAASDWGFSRTTEGDYERLAAESIPARVAPPLGVNEPLRPFSWPEPQEETGSALPVVDPLVLPDPPGAPAPNREEAAAEEAVAAAPAVHDAEAQPAEPAPSHAAAPAQEARPEALVESVPAPAHVPADQAAEQAPERASEPQPDPVRAAPVPAGSPAPTEDETEDDRTIVVARRSRWGLELPDGEIVELVGEDIIVGRKPQPVDGAVVLQIPDPTRTMSKSHVRMRRTGDDWTIEDLGSTNGVALVDGAGDPVPLEPGSESAATEMLVIGTLEVRLRQLD